MDTGWITGGRAALPAQLRGHLPVPKSTFVGGDMGRLAVGTGDVRRQTRRCQKAPAALALGLVFLPWFLGSLQLYLLGCLLFGENDIFIYLSAASYNLFGTAPCLLSKTLCDFYVQKVN